MKKLLNESTVPFYNMIKNWIFCGEIDDLYKEFFIGKSVQNDEDDIWNSKYSIRSSMLPIFIPLSMANRILCVGKSIDFLRTSCKQNFSLPEKIQTRADLHPYSEVEYLEKLVTYSERVK